MHLSTCLIRPRHCVKSFFLCRALAHTPGSSAAVDSTQAPSSASTSGNGSSSTSSSEASSSSAAAEAAEQEQYPTPGAAVEAAVAAGLPSQLADAMTADALAEEGPALVDEWVTWLRLWRARLAEEGMQEEVGTDLPSGICLAQCGFAQSAVACGGVRAY